MATELREFVLVRVTFKLHSYQ